MTLNINDFKSQLANGGARGNLFKIIVNFPTYAIQNGQETQKSSFLCRAGQIPGATVNVIEVPFRGRMLKLAGDRTFENWQVTMYNDESFDVHSAFVRWQNGINNLQTNEGLSDVTEYTADIRVQQLNRQEEVIKEFIIENAFPATIGAIDLKYDAATSIEEFTVNFAYQHWKSADTIVGSIL